MNSAKFARRVIVHAPGSDRIVFVATDQFARILVGLKQAKPRSGKTVREIDLTHNVLKASKMGLRPGSFGIERETLTSGVKVFQHHGTWDKVLKQAA